MPGRRAGGPFVVKLVGVFPGNAALGLEAHQAVIALFDATTGRCLALMDGEHITALRTAAAAALSVRALAREDARTAAIVGSGVQARAHLLMLPLVRDFAEIRLIARDPSAAERLGAVPAATPGDAGVICLTTVVRGARPARGRGRRRHARHLGRLRPARRRARPAARRLRAPLRRDPRRLRPPARRRRGAGRPRPGRGHGARRRPRRPRPRPHVRHRDHGLQGHRPRRRGRRRRRAGLLRRARARHRHRAGALTRGTKRGCGAAGSPRAAGCRRPEARRSRRRSASGPGRRAGRAGPGSGRPPRPWTAR